VKTAIKLLPVKFLTPNLKPPWAVSYSTTNFAGAYYKISACFERKTAFVRQNLRNLGASGGGGDHFLTKPPKGTSLADFMRFEPLSVQIGLGVFLKARQHKREKLQKVTEMLYFTKMVEWEFPANRWNITSLWLFVVFLFYVASPRGKTPEPICMLNGSKRVKSAKDVPFGGFVKKWSPPPAPKFRKFCLTKAVFRSKHALTKIGIWVGVADVINNAKLGNDRSREYKVTEGRILACSIGTACRL